MIQKRGDAQMALRNKFQVLIDALSVTNQNRKGYNFEDRNNRALELKKLGPAEFAFIRDRQVIAICNLFGYRKLT
jgi:hypothetical protein